MEELEAPYLRMFSFYLPKGEPPEQYRDEVFRRMEQMVKLAEARGAVMLHENEKGIYGDNASRCRDLMEQFYGRHFQAVFDFANFVEVGQETLEAYELLKPYLAYIHIKDVSKALGKVVPAGKGDGKVREILSDLIGSGWRGFLSLEPHLVDFSGLKALEQNAAARNAAMDGKTAWKMCIRDSCVLTGIAAMSYLLIYRLVKSCRNETQLQEIAYADHLTGLRNRAGLFFDANTLMENKTPFSLVFMDLNRFKSINDSYGHLAGDRYLCWFSKHVQELLDSQGRLYRMSGDEFVCLYTGRETPEFVKNIRLLPRVIQEEKIPFWGCSVGVSCYPEDSCSLDRLIDVYKRQSWYNNETYVNTLDKRATERFAETTHEVYAGAVGAEFGKAVPSIFTDEPQFVHKETLGKAEEKKPLILPYTDDFEDSYRAAYGESFLDRLPEVVWELPDGVRSLTRYRYHDHIAQRFARCV